MMPQSLISVEPWWQPLQTLVDTQIPSLTANVWTALQQLGHHVAQPVLAGALFLGDQRGAIQLLLETIETVARPAIEIAIAGVMREVLSRTVLRAKWAFFRDSAFPLTSVVFPPESVWSGYLADRITQLLTTTKTAVAGIVHRALSARPEMPMRQQVQEMTAQVGLTDHVAPTVARYRAGLQESGYTSEQISTLVTRRAQSLMQQRAAAIAETELMAAVNYGTRWAMQEAVREGKVDVTAVRRFWRVTDAEACAKCQAIVRRHPRGVRLDEPFQGPGGAVMGPPLHVFCRCFEDYEIG